MHPVSVTRAKLQPVVVALSAGSAADVGTLLIEMDVSLQDFFDLVEHPDYWGRGDWHDKLRQFRNQDEYFEWIRHYTMQ